MLSDVDQIVESFKEELTLAVQQVLIKNGVEKNSNLVKSIEWTVQNGVFVMLANDYYEYVSTGRRPRARKVPIMALVQWIKDKRLKGRNKKTGRFITNNSLAFAIQNSIYKNGIKGKNFITEVDEVVGDIAEIRMAEGLEDLLILELDKTFLN